MKRTYPHNGREDGSINKKKRRQQGRTDYARKGTQWLKGRLCPIKKQNAWFIKPMIKLPDGYDASKDVFMYPNYISPFVLPVVEGDTLEFILGDRDKTKPMAMGVRVSQYSPRTCKGLIEYIKKLTGDLNGTNVKKVFMEILPCTAMWKFLGSPTFKGAADTEITTLTYCEFLLNLLKLVLQRSKPYKMTLLGDTFDTITQGEIFIGTSDQSLPAIIKSCSYNNDDKFYSEKHKATLSVTLVESFCQDVIRRAPHVTSCLLPTIVAVSEKVSSPSTQRFLCTILSINFGNNNKSFTNERMWMELPLIPTDNELAGHLVEEDKNLRPVRTCTPYDDAEQYLDIYFRLIRAETFSAIQHGIQDLKASTLDSRDMNVYLNIQLVGCGLLSGRFSLAIRFTPVKNVKRWQASTQLMFGNLVCISMNQTFNDVIWATVSNKDAELLNEQQIIRLELLDENVKSVGEIIDMLQRQGGSGIMVESPTYYHSLSPVLRSLREFEMEDFPLQKEIVYAKPSQELPEYLKGATLDTSIVLTQKGFWCDEETNSTVEHMDTSEILENNMNSTFLRNPDISSTATGTFLSEPPSSNTLSESKEKDSHEREEVSRFLELVNSSSQSCLEASQCNALVHALKNKLAVIQGPPGCGKTYLGVKIVQLLLSLSPKLEKPILLLTYKNHALDEFLKHMLDFCSRNDMVRIGGRSKELELETCNLKYLMRCELGLGGTQIEIQNRFEIANVEKQIREVLEEVETSFYLTQRSLVDELSEEQIQSLILGAGKESISPFLRLGRNKGGSELTKQLLDDILETKGSVKEFLQEALESGASEDEVEITCIKVFGRAFEQWLPDLKELQTMSKFQESTLQIQRDTNTQDTMSTESQGADNYDDSGDEDYVNQLLEMRMDTGAKQGFRSNSPLIFDDTETDSSDILVSISDFPGAIAVNEQIHLENNLWSLDQDKRLKFLYSILNPKITRVYQELNDLIERLKSLKDVREEFEMNNKVEMLSKKKIIGVTITGASINHDLLRQIGPSVVIVEEAAEILEPSLLAALTSSIEHLILIGDHKQLRPQVDTYELVRNFQFDISMMERLIGSKFPFKSLAKQNRMRLEFSALLRDIYPNLKDNLPLVSKNRPLKCIEKSMFFWCHDDPEKKDRTYTNIKEAERITALVMYLLCNGVRPSDITVLAAYLGQTKLLRNKIKQEKANQSKFFRELDEKGAEREGFVEVQTIDMYQGDENKYVIVSLVRSNEENRIGFLKSINRRCVAQSRAKCGMYFVGNRNTLCEAKGSCWSKFISSMKKQGCVGYEFPLQCTRHETSKYKAIDGKSIRAVNAQPKLLCDQPCGDIYPKCDKHPCTKPCRLRHHHNICPKLVDDRFPDCDHGIKRSCSKKLSDYRCQIKVTATFPRCEHKTEKPCHVKIENIKCQHPCKKLNSCGIHQCKDVCGNSHGHESCPKLIDYKFPDCDHPSSEMKPCSKEITWKCKYKVSFKGRCGHEIQKECHQKESEVKCLVKPCGRQRKCDHPCINACGDDCEKGECKHCRAVQREKMRKDKKQARERYYELDKKIKDKEFLNFSRDELCSTGPTAPEHQKVKDQVLKFIQPCHHWFPTITKIEKVTNLELEMKFEEAKSRAFGDHIDTKFHGTTDEALEDIIKKGFKMPDPNPPPDKRGMFGQGIYFATDSSKSAQKIYTQGSQKLLLCQVILGRSKEVLKADYSLNKKKLLSQKYDSVYAPRGSAVKNDEFVIFNADQALPQYIIHFSNATALPSPSTLKIQQTFIVKSMVPLRTVDTQDPFQMYYMWADSHFRRMAASSKPPLQATISSIDIVINKDLEDKFEATKKTFKSQGISDKEILAYHGTDPKNINSILKNNLQLSYAKRQVYGKGNYFSEFPAVSLGYGAGLLLCRILPGKEFEDSNSVNIPVGYNSKKVLLRDHHTSATRASTAAGSATSVSGEMIIIENSDQILPFFVIHR